MHKEKIYISGQISGLEREKYVTEFNKAFFYLFSFPDKIPVNPVKQTEFLYNSGCKSWLVYIIYDIFTLFFCDAIYMLSNYRNSRGAKLELFFARLFRKKVYFEGKMKNDGQ